jgi:hypothetical protein
MLITFGDLKNSSLLNVSGVTPTSDAFRRLVNEGTRRLLARGDWDGTVIPMLACIDSGSCVVWPRYVGSVRQLNFCRQHVPIKNVWWDFLPYDRHLGWEANDWYRWTNGPWFSGKSMVNQARSPVFQAVQGDGRTIRVYPESALDNGKTITIFGEDNNGERLMTRGAGPWTDGIKLVLNAQPSQQYTETLTYVRRIDRVLKDQTTAPVRLYAWNATSNVLEDVAYYEPSEMRPNYLRSRLSLPCVSNSCNGVANSLRSVIALVKLAYVPVVADTDPVLIGNITALKHAIQCIRREEAEDPVGGKVWLDLAVDELNQDLKDANPDSQIPVDLGELGHNQHYLGNQQVF